MPGSNVPPSSPVTGGERSLYCLQSVQCGFSLLDEIIFTVKISVVEWHHVKAATFGISSDSQNTSGRLHLHSVFCCYIRRFWPLLTNQHTYLIALCSIESIGNLLSYAFLVFILQYVNGPCNFLWCFCLSFAL